MKHGIFGTRILWNENAGGGNQLPAPAATPPAAPPAPALPPEAQPGYEKLVGRYGGTDAVSVLLYSQTYELREQLRQANAKIPPEGSIVLNGEEAASYQATLSVLTELNLKPEQIKTQILEKKKLERDALLSDVARAANFNLDALKAVHGVDVMDFEIREEADPANPEAKIKKVYTKDGEGKDIPLEQFPSVVPLLPALKVQSAPAEPNGVPFVRQPSGGAPPAPNDVVGAFLQNEEQRNNAQPNPLMPQPAVPAAPAVNALGG